MTKRLWFISLALLSLLFSCKQEEPLSTVADLEYTKTIHYKVKVNGSVSTRASLNEHTQYVFEANDRLFVSHIESGNTVLYGVLSLMSGAGSTTAIFEGDLACLEEFEVQSSTPIDVTLVSSQDRLHSFAEGKITGTTYPDNEFASTLSEAVQKFSNFTCSTTFGATNFTLIQNTSFLVFNIKLKPSEAPAGTPVTLTISNGSTPIWSTTVQAETYNAITRTYFVIGIEGEETTLSNAKLSLSWTNAQTPYSKEFDDLVDGTLAANHYYTIVRSALTFDGFRIRAKEDGTKVYFYYTDGSGRRGLPLQHKQTAESILMPMKRPASKAPGQTATSQGTTNYSPPMASYVISPAISQVCLPIPPRLQPMPLEEHSPKRTPTTVK